MKTAVFIVCLIGMACALPYSSESHSNSVSDPDSSSSSSEERLGTSPTVNTATVQTLITDDFPRGDSLRRRRALKGSSSESHSNSVSDPDSSSSSSEERLGTSPTVNTATAQTLITDDFPRGDSLRRRRRALKGSSESSHQDTNSIESHSISKSDSLPDSSSSEEHRTVPTPDGTTLVQARGDSFRRRRDLEQVAPGSSSHHSEESVTTESTSHQSLPTESSEEDSHEHSNRKNLLLGILGATTVDPHSSAESSEERTTPAFQP